MRNRPVRESGFNIVELRLAGLVFATLIAVICAGLWRRGWHVPAIVFGIVGGLPMLAFGLPALLALAQAIADRVRGR